MQNLEVLAFLVEFGVEDEVSAFPGAVYEQGVLVGFVLHVFQN